jgi:hypothetical protein
MHGSNPTWWDEQAEAAERASKQSAKVSICDNWTLSHMDTVDSSSFLPLPSVVLPVLSSSPQTREIQSSLPGSVVGKAPPSTAASGARPVSWEIYPSAGPQSVSSLSFASRDPNSPIRAPNPPIMGGLPMSAPRAMGGMMPATTEIVDATVEPPNSVPPRGTIQHHRDFREFWRKTSKVLFLLTILSSLAVSGVGIWYLVEAHSEKYVMFWAVAAFFVTIAVPISLHAIHLNMMFYRHKLQRFYIQILWMVPIYSVQSWLALYFWPQKVYLETGRECYEAYVVYAFVRLLRDFLGETEEEQIRALEEIAREEDREHCHHLMFCFNVCMPKWRLGKQFLRQCSYGVMQVCHPL